MRIYTVSDLDAQKERNKQQTSSVDRTDEFFALVGLRPYTVRVKNVGSSELASRYKRYCEPSDGSVVAPSREQLARSVKAALISAQREALNGEQLAHVIVVGELIVQDNRTKAFRKLKQQIDEQSKRMRFARGSQLSRSTALYQIHTDLETISNAYELVSLLVQEQEKSVRRLEEGTLSLERNLNRAEMELMSHRSRETRTLLVKLTLVFGSSLALFVFLFI